MTRLLASVALLLALVALAHGAEDAKAAEKTAAAEAKQAALTSGFMTWYNEMGGINNKVDVRFFESMGRGVGAVEPIHEVRGNGRGGKRGGGSARMGTQREWRWDTRRMGEGARARNVVEGKGDTKTKRPGETGETGRDGRGCARPRDVTDRMGGERAHTPASAHRGTREERETERSS